MTGRDRCVRLEPYTGPWPDGHKDANFLQDMVLHSHNDPMTTIDRLAAGIGVPPGAVARYVLAKWAASGSEGLLEIGPRVVRQMQQAIDEAERADTAAARLQAYETLRQIVSWLAVPLSKPQS